MQVRDKALSARDLLALARALLPACQAREVPLLVNDRVDVARAAGAGGAHLPGGGFSCRDARSLLGAGALVATSCHDAEEVARSASEGADFCVFGPVWEVPGKGRALGPERLAAAVRGAGLPVLALGGIDARTAPIARAAGASGVACIRGVLGAQDPAAAARALWLALSG